jgi:predicted Zn-dependent protease with MMP-like domain
VERRGLLPAPRLIRPNEGARNPEAGAGPVNLEDFSACVAQAIEELPDEFRRKLENVEVIVEDFAHPDTLAAMRIRSPYGLLGLYRGIPITQQSVFYVNPLPDRIYLYRIPILAAAAGKRDVVQKIREVVIHEVGHHFGFDDAELEEMERRSR